MSKLLIADTNYLNDCSAKDLSIIQARYDSMPLDKMVEEFGFKDKICVANLFTPTGRLRNAYDEFKDIMHQSFLEEALNIQKKAISPAMKIMVKNMGSSNGNISNAAAKYILDRELGSPKQSVEHTGEMPLQIIIKAPENVRPEPRVVDVVTD